MPKELLNRELTTDKRAGGWAQLRFMDVCKRDVRAMDIDIERWKDMAKDRVTLETQFTPMVGARSEETNACRRREEYSTEREKQGDIRGEPLRKHSFQSRQ